jgi:hypothetical protein
VVFFDALQIPQGVAGRPEKLAAQVVVNPDHLVAFTIETNSSFRADKTA